MWTPCNYGHLAIMDAVSCYYRLLLLLQSTCTNLQMPILQMLWFNFILGSIFIFLWFCVW